MESVGGDMASIMNVLKYGLPYQANLAVHADGLAAHAKLVTSAFERKVTGGPTDAEPEIWEKTDEFAKGVKALETETAKLAEVVKAAILPRSARSRPWAPAAVATTLPVPGKSHKRNAGGE
jgi:cytochrome c556